MLRDRFGVSQLRACRVVGQHRSTQRLEPTTVSDEEAELRAFLRAFSKDRPRWGWRRAAKAARRSGWRVNDKRIQRLWREEGLKVPYRKRKKPHRGIGTAVGAMCPIALNALWAMDFQFDAHPNVMTTPATTRTCSRRTTFLGRDFARGAPDPWWVGSCRPGEVGPPLRYGPNVTSTMGAVVTRSSRGD
jgi:hypothetical protein